MPAPTVSLYRLQARLEELGTFGRNPEGGITRVPFSPAHVEAVLCCAQWMREAGLTVGVDEFGNLVGLRKSEGGPALITGSHLDTVPQGGMFDGALGVVAAIECAQVLHEGRRSLRHSYVAIAFAEEEGYAFGSGTLSSRSLLGELTRDRFTELVDGTGRTYQEYLLARAHGLPQAQVPAQVRAYIELHVEQGPHLERMAKQVASVDQIVGSQRTVVRFEGRAAHAGTTPMDRRADALLGGAELVLAVNEIATASNGRGVGTVGELHVYPGARNVVPGKAALSVEFRSQDDDWLASARERTDDAAAKIADRRKLAIRVARWSVSPVQPLDSELHDVILTAMRSAGHDAVTLSSWAGHDAGILARYVPSGMIFVPSSGGISHTPQEHTPWPAVEAGTQVLLETILRLDATKGTGRSLPLAYAAR
jgi:N-carbamoyl-L-amino-acid hydrolase